MLVILSDLHFTDGTATSDNIPARAFALFLDHVLDLALHAKAKKLQLLFLGDIFDLLRTEHWFRPSPPGANPSTPDPFPEADRPWGTSPITKACVERAVFIAEQIANVCHDQFDVLSGRNLASVAGTPLHARLAPKLQRLVAVSPTVTPDLVVERYYLPGNHDRLARCIAPVLDIILKALGAVPAPESEAGAVRLGSGVLARHGHEFDAWNFEAAAIGTMSPSPEDYLQVPIGDPITTECLARLPYQVRAELIAAGLPAQHVSAVYGHLQAIEDVRPLGSAMRWILDARTQAWQGNGALILATIERVAKGLVPKLLRMRFTRAWRKRRLLGRGLSIVLLLYVISALSRFASLRSAAWLLGIWDAIRRFMAGTDRYVKAAARIVAQGVDYVVLGHTHHFKHVPLRVSQNGPKVYVNSGTWRPRAYEALVRPGFLHAKDMTYLVFYDSNEQPVGPSRATSFEAWNGVMMKR